MKTLVSFLAQILCLPALIAVDSAQATTRAHDGDCLSADTNPDHDGAHDYDFISGRKWSIHGRKRVGRFIHSTQWEEMDGFENSRRVGETGMIEDTWFPQWRPNYKLLILRLYDASTKRWSIYDAHNPQSVSPPLYGQFHSGLGVFVGDDTIDNVPVKVRYTWTCDWTHPRFQQELSNDAGKTWEIDWQMEFTEVK